MMLAGLGVLGMTGVVTVVSALTGNVAQALASTGSLIAVGTGMFAIGAVRLPGWAKLRRRQMEGVAARLALGADAPAPKELAAGEDDSQ